MPRSPYPVRATPLSGVAGSWPDIGSQERFGYRCLGLRANSRANLAPLQTAFEDGLTEGGYG
jgi:hypothetical protein